MSEASSDDGRDYMDEVDFLTEEEIAIQYETDEVNLRLFQKYFFNKGTI